MTLVEIDQATTRAAYIDSRVRLTDRAWSGLVGWSHDANRRKGMIHGVNAETTDGRLRSLLLRAERRISDNPDWAYGSFVAVWSVDARVIPESSTSTKPTTYNMIIFKRGDTLTIDARPTSVDS